MPAYSLVLGLDRQDSSGNGYHVTPQNFDGDEQVPAVIGTGLNMGGVSDSLSLSQSLGPYPQLTVEVFLQRDDNSSWDAILTADGWSSQYFHYHFPPGDNLESGLNSQGIASVNFSGINTTTWHYVVLVYDKNNTSSSYYLDGVLGKNTVDLTFARDAILPTSHIGSWNGSSRFFKGKMDEMRLSSVARSGEWINTQYLSMTDSLLVFGGETEIDEN